MKVITFMLCVSIAASFRLDSSARSAECNACVDRTTRLADAIKDPEHAHPRWKCSYLKNGTFGNCQRVMPWPVRCTRYAYANAAWANEKYFKFVGNYLSNADAVCTQLGPCSYESMIHREIRYFAVRTVQEQLLAKLNRTSVDNIQEYKENIEQNCENCQSAITELRNMLLQGSVDTQNELKWGTMTLCQIFVPYQLIDQCMNAVSDNWEHLLNVFLNSAIVSPKDVCTDMRACVGRSRFRKYRAEVNDFSPSKDAWDRAYNSSTQFFQASYSTWSQQDDNGNWVVYRRNTYIRPIFNETIGYTRPCLLCEMGRKVALELLERDGDEVMQRLEYAVCIRGGDMLFVDDATIAECRRLFQADGKEVLRYVQAMFDESFCANWLCTADDVASINQLSAANRTELDCQACKSSVAALKEDFANPVFLDVFAPYNALDWCSWTGDYFWQCKTLVETVLPGYISRYAEALIRNNGEYWCDRATHYNCPASSLMI